jgi:hypothetical protein
VGEPQKKPFEGQGTVRQDFKLRLIAHPNFTFHNCRFSVIPLFDCWPTAIPGTFMRTTVKRALLLVSHFAGFCLS